jgi:hypothetical protein
VNIPPTRQIFSIDPAAGALGRRIVAEMERITLDRIGGAAMENARRNRAYLMRGRSLADLRDAAIGEGDSAIVVAAGPSVRRRDPLASINASGYRGAIISTDSGLAYCLRSGVVPDLVVSVDPHPTWIVRWFGDPELTLERLPKDDYYRRQDLDETFAHEIKTNQEVLDLVNRYGTRISIALATSTSAAVVERVLSVGMKIYWWNPMLDDPDRPDSRTRALFRMNGLPCVNAGGNVGTACWMMAHAALGKKFIALTGIDFSYYIDTPYEKTQYYPDIVALVGKENLDQVFMPVHNPYLGAWFYTDPAYMWYREAFLDLAKDAGCVTSNCTEGGILFGDSVRFEPLDDFLARHARKPADR